MKLPLKAAIVEPTSLWVLLPTAIAITAMMAILAGGQDQLKLQCSSLENHLPYQEGVNWNPNSQSDHIFFCISGLV